MITNFKIFEKLSNYNVDDIVIATNPTEGLNNRMVVIDSIHQDRNGKRYTVWNASKNESDTEFTISENDIVKKMPRYNEGDYILIKDYYTRKIKPMIMLNHVELGMFEMINLEYTDEVDDEEGENFEYVEEPYYNIIRKMTKKDLEKYKDVIEKYHIKKAKNKYNI